MNAKKEHQGALAQGCALRMKPSSELEKNVERSWRPTLGTDTWYLAAWGDGRCAVARTPGGYSMEFIGMSVLSLFDVVSTAVPTGGGTWVTEEMVNRAGEALLKVRGVYEGEHPVQPDELRAALEAAFVSATPADVGNAALLKLADEIDPDKEPGSRSFREVARDLRVLASAGSASARSAVPEGFSLVETAPDEVLVALKRGEGYEDVHPQLVAEDAIGDRWPEYRTIPSVATTAREPETLLAEHLDREVDDYCECTGCGFVGLVKAGGEVCPRCGVTGRLMDAPKPWDAPAMGDAIDGCEDAGPQQRGAGNRVAPRVFVDLDGVVVDFDRYRDERGLTGDQVKALPGAYLDMPAIPGAIEAVRSLIGMGYEVWLATKPPTGIPHAYSDKAAWVMQHLPELKRRIIITHDKGLLGCERDFLCDDRPHKANCEKFRGTLVPFVDGYHWPQALDFFRQRRARKG